MFSVLLQTGLESLTDPDSVTTGFSILIVGLLTMVAYIGVKFKSVMILFMWFASIVVLSLSILLGIPFDIFWAILILTAIVIVIAVLIGDIWDANV